MKRIILFILCIMLTLGIMSSCNPFQGEPPVTYTREITVTIIISEDMDDLPHLRQKGGGANAVTVWNAFHDTYTIEMLGTSWQGKMFDPNSEVLGHEIKHVLHMKDPLRIVTVHAP